jgi:hypothetical protein
MRAPQVPSPRNGVNMPFHASMMAQQMAENYRKCFAHVRVEDYFLTQVQIWQYRMHHQRYPGEEEEICEVLEALNQAFFLVCRCRTPEKETSSVSSSHRVSP